MNKKELEKQYYDAVNKRNELLLIVKNETLEKGVDGVSDSDSVKALEKAVEEAEALRALLAGAQ